MPGAVRASLAPYNTEIEVDRFLDAVSEMASSGARAQYTQTVDGEYEPAGGWAPIEIAL